MAFEDQFIYAAEFEHLTCKVVAAAIASDDDVYAPLDRRSSAPDGVPAYLANLYRIPLLTPQGEADLFRAMNYYKYLATALRAKLDAERPDVQLMDRIERLLHDAERIRNQVVESNLRLVVSIARRFSASRWQFEELVAEGNMILMKAVTRFDYAQGFRFSTYLTHAVQRHFYRHFKNSQRRKNVEVSTSQAILSEVASADEDDSYVDVDPARMKRLLVQIDGCLDERERYVLRERFGLGPSGEQRTLQSLSGDLGVCKERVRQLHHKAIAKIRQQLQRNVELSLLRDAVPAHESVGHNS